MDKPRYESDKEQKDTTGCCLLMVLIVCFQSGIIGYLLAILLSH